MTRAATRALFSVARQWSFSVSLASLALLASGCPDNMSPPPPPPPQPYQELWELDQGALGRGIEPILPVETPARTDRKVEVHETSTVDPQHRLFRNVNIPTAAADPYDRVEALEDNFDPFRGEEHDAADLQEMRGFIASVAGTKVLARARELFNTNERFTNHLARANGDWQAYLLDFWFGPFKAKPTSGESFLETTTAAEALQALGDPGLVALLGNRTDIPPAYFDLPIPQFLAKVSASGDQRLDQLLYALVADGAALLVHAAGTRSAFEHVFLGEYAGRLSQDEPDGIYKLGGYHFWHKYFRDDGDTVRPDVISYRGLQYANGLEIEGRKHAFFTIFSYGVHLTDTQSTPPAERFSIKLKGSMFNGCSPEGLMALAMTRFYDGPQTSTMNRARLSLEAPANGRYLNTFYFGFLGEEGPAPPSGLGTVP